MVGDGGAVGNYPLVLDQYDDFPPTYSNSVPRDFMGNSDHLRRDSLHTPTMNKSGRAYRRPFLSILEARRKDRPRAHTRYISV